jgi:glyoxylase-like metal-dependent hydrolase (beta-lactamase superfamily II)
MATGHQPLQFFDPQSSTYTYLLTDADTRDCVLIDPVDEESQRYLDHLAAHGLRLVYILETHVHADHVTAAAALRSATRAQTGAPAGCGVSGADLAVLDGEILKFGGETVEVIHTPGHTPCSVTYRWRDCVFTGDALLIGGCGRTDFQGGDAGALYDAITGRLFSLPDSTRVFPGHDYRGNTHTTIGEQKRSNPRLAGKTREEFIEIMQNLKLAPPKLIDVAVPANKRGGVRQEA